MQLKSGQTYDGALRFVEELMAQGLNDLQTAMPHIPGGVSIPGSLRSSSQRAELTAAVRRYDDWTGKAGRAIRAVFADPSIVARLRGERYQAILVTGPDEVRLPILLNTELAELRDYFTEVANEVRLVKDRHKGHQGRTLVLDTNDLLHYQRFDKIPWQRQYGAGTAVVIPHVVVDEIDTKAFTESEKVRRRARGVFKLLEDVLTAVDADGWTTLPDGTALRILADEPGHRRLPNNDDELVSRAAALQQAIAPHEVLVVTRDNGVRTRALSWRLAARKLDDKYLIPADQLAAADLARDLETITVEVQEDLVPSQADAPN
ncbi:PIN domain-containing protein [Kitasatospora paracochleata]|uniref:PIN domain-containing protein n=1 Tax=Kitasatospora paracochleata TaxID=58354 RepID=A0ABT1J9W5_9ACTN|nr:PIN domain-containing protein [Kitasatospora paracochleata]MCP2314163.1 hypothetical protein [Kitasatospora paracochleata]